jgi:integrase
VLSKAVRDNIILKNPSLEVASIKAVSAKRVHLNPEEIEALARTPLAGELGAEMRRAFLFACFVGLRVSDIKQLKWGDIEMNPLQIIKRQKKTEEVVSIPLNESAWALINDGALHNYAECVFPLLGAQGELWNDIIGKWARAAGVEKHVTWHVARHTFAVQALESGAEIYTVSRLLGHTDREDDADLREYHGQDETCGGGRAAENQAGVAS